MMKRYETPCRLAILTLAVGVSNVSMAFGQDADRQARLGEFVERLEETRSRLDLTDEQVEQIRPILRSSFEAQARVLRKHGIDLERRSGKDRRLGLRQLRQLGRDLDAVRKQTLEKLSGKLTNTQIEEYGKIQQERRQAMRKRLRQRRR